MGVQEAARTRGDSGDSMQARQASAVRAPGAVLEPGEAPWMGRWRPSMATNALIAKAPLGKPRPVMFMHPAPDHVFGVQQPADKEGVKQGGYGALGCSFVGLRAPA